jgi:predicted O-linked N-acetylglucosamine transferase (SPINDLY family)
LHYLPDIRPQMLFDEHERWGQIHAPLSRARTSHDNEPAPDRRLRIGYISPDFYMHPVAYFFEPLLDGHDPQAVEVYGYGSVEFPDRITERLRRKFAHYRDIHGINDETVVRMIEDDKIDILVDLTGHTAGNRLLVLACKPAPIQVTCLGYSNTTGVQAVDYRLTDSKLDSPESQKFYTEELVFLSGPFSCYRPSELAPPIASLPALRKGYVTFGSFNNNCKIHPLIIKLWSQILRENGSSRLLLRFKGGSDRNVADHYYHQFEQLQVNRERVIIDGWQSYVEHLQMYKDVDIALDTYPWNGHTTTCETMWMGVPTISLAGKSSVSRVGLSILSCVGLEFLATSTPDEYVAKAAALARNLNALAKMRASMRQRMTASSLCDAKTHAGSVEAAYRKMWNRWCRSRSVEVLGEQLSETAYSRV